MFEEQTYEAILARMNARAGELGLDTREGSVVWLGNAPAAVELQNLYIALDTVLAESYGDKASRPYLILRAAERGLAPYPASSAVVSLEVTPKELEIPINTRFSTGDLCYYVSENLGNGQFALTCEQSGSAGNALPARIYPVGYVAGLEGCAVTDLLEAGEDEEDTEHFRTRYLESLVAQSFGGNRADYVAKVSALSGVGGVKVFRGNDEEDSSKFTPPAGAKDWLDSLERLPDGVGDWLAAVYESGAAGRLTDGGDVSVVITDSRFHAPDEGLLGRVQNALDPLGQSGLGYGIAPIGHRVTVTGVTEEPMNLRLRLAAENGRTWGEAVRNATAAAEEFFAALARGWAAAEGLTVRLSRLESCLLAAEGVADAVVVALNGGTENITLSARKVPVLGEITVEEGV